MKLTKEFIDKYLNDFHYELTREQLEQEWRLDKKPYYKEKDCFTFHAKDGCWLEVSRTDMPKAFEPCDELAMINLNKDLLESLTSGNFESSWNETKTLEEIGKEDFKESSFYAGMEHEKKVAIAACQKVIDSFYESKFDPSIDYMKIFKENL